MGREFTRQELYDLVWREPLRTLAKTLLISSELSSARRTCSEAVRLAERVFGLWLIPFAL